MTQSPHDKLTGINYSPTVPDNTSVAQPSDASNSHGEIASKQASTESAQKSDHMADNLCAPSDQGYRPFGHGMGR